ncbi:hypothetical protein CAEBREN_16992 [Caenorhabditis brenneri]|uniref:Uncharacterized protein n=1 Tax=Caenorhabditis brenneri TaxID=135651 RepID=G0NLX0_CAEBE|nr:hypothetical protein CAEBREN_16992 [Caenorhabditis brenneri]
MASSIREVAALQQQMEHVRLQYSEIVQRFNAMKAAGVATGFTPEIVSLLWKTVVQNSNLAAPGVRITCLMCESEVFPPNVSVHFGKEHQNQCFKCTKQICQCEQMDNRIQWIIHNN